MIHADFEPYFRPFAERLIAAGLTLVEESAFKAVFRKNEAWQVIYAGEPTARPAAEVVAQIDSKDHRKKAFIVRVVMRLHAERAGLPEPRPSLDNIAAFIVDHGDILFSQPPVYEADYDRVMR